MPSTTTATFTHRERALATLLAQTLVRQHKLVEDENAIREINLEKVDEHPQDGQGTMVFSFAFSVYEIVYHARSHPGADHTTQCENKEIFVTLTYSPDEQQVTYVEAGVRGKIYRSAEFAN